MKKYILFLFAIILSITLKAQEINQFDQNDKRHGLWKKKFKNGKIRYQGEFNHGKEIGIFKFYSIKTSKHPTIIKEFNDLNSYAMVKFYSKRGVIESIGKMNGKDRVGPWIYYHKDGKTTMQEEFYVNNKLNGDFKTFYPNKKPTILTIYKNGKIDGSYKRFSIQNRIYQDLNYSNGKLEGAAIYYDRLTGIIEEKGIYKDDERVGVWKIFIDGEFAHTIDVDEEKRKLRIKN
jgi:antitoxin component YwqK of YwqJK toxin-antitoxin module